VVCKAVAELGPATAKPDPDSVIKAFHVTT